MACLIPYSSWTSFLYFHSSSSKPQHLCLLLLSSWGCRIVRHWSSLPVHLHHGRTHIPDETWKACTCWLSIPNHFHLSIGFFCLFLRKPRVQRRYCLISLAFAMAAYQLLGLDFVAFVLGPILFEQRSRSWGALWSLMGLSGLGQNQSLFVCSRGRICALCFSYPSSRSAFHSSWFVLDSNLRQALDSDHISYWLRKWRHCSAQRRAGVAQEVSKYQSIYQLVLNRIFSYRHLDKIQPPSWNPWTYWSCIHHLCQTSTRALSWWSISDSASYVYILPRFRISWQQMFLSTHGTPMCAHIFDLGNMTLEYLKPLMLSKIQEIKFLFGWISFFSQKYNDFNRN